MTKNNKTDPSAIAERLSRKAAQQTLAFSANEPTLEVEQPSEDKNMSDLSAQQSAQQVHEDVLRQILMNSVTLPGKPEHTTLIPSELVRCALFNARNKNRAREFMKHRELISIGKQRLEYTGEDLRQDDCDLYLKVIELAAEQYRAEPINAQSKIHVSFTLYRMAKELGVKKFCTRRKKAMIESLNRLRFGLIAIQSERILNQTQRKLQTISFNLLSDFTLTEQQGGPYAGHLVTCELPLALVFLLQGSHHTRILWIQRNALRSPVAKWLINYLSSHREPFPIKLDTVITGAGLLTKDKYEAKRTIQNALRELLSVGFLEQFDIQKGLITVSRAPAPEMLEAV